jgi:hypothetical protein
MIYCKLLEHNCGVAISEPLYNCGIKVRDRLKEIAFPQKRDRLFPAMTYSGLSACGVKKIRFTQIDLLL